MRILDNYQDQGRIDLEQLSDLNVERNLKDMNIESRVLIRERLSGEYGEADLVNTMVL